DVPMWSGEKIYKRVRELGLSVKYIVATHGHWDHTGEMKKLKSLTVAVVCANKGDEWMMIDPNGMVIAPPEPIEPVKVEIPLVDGSDLSVGGITFSVIHTPGHSAGSICLYEANAKILFTGDTLFAGSIGRIDLPTGSMEEISKSILEKIMTLPGDVKIYPGHGPGSTLKRERMENQFVQMMLAER
ncbi:MAG TPA: MBL fold metallo-hydrolase, partial [Candidatus Kryptobacter bacterium]|nr:MBL fold metallo-hydrolase [Candidatus Kryptobacter bacterium]